MTAADVSSAQPETANIHATAVAIGGHAVLIGGPTGSGKSDLALRLIDRGATLIADDRCCIARVGDRLLVSPPPTLAGLIEVRGVGIVKLPHISGVPAALWVSLDRPSDRLPSGDESMLLAGCRLPAIALGAFAASTPIAVELALAGLTVAMPSIAET